MNLRGGWLESSATVLGPSLRGGRKRERERERERERRGEERRGTPQIFVSVGK